MIIKWADIGEKIYSILKGSCKSVSLYDEAGNSTIDPEKATRFFATFRSSNPKLDTFTVLVACHDEGHDSHIDLKTPNVKDEKDFEKIHQIRNHIRGSIGSREGIKVNWLVFDHAINPKDEAIHNKKDTVKEGTKMKKLTDKSIAESKDVSKVYGTTKSSFQQIGEAKLIIRHSATVNENVHGARSRQIKALFVENKIGERFAYPHLHVTGARAFARHISNGGTNHDAVATKLYSLSEDYIKLRRTANSLRLNESANDVWVERLKESMNEINRKLKSMHGPKGYKNVTASMLEETASDLDETFINNLRDQIAECCGCPCDSQGYDDVGTAAKYIAAKGPVPEPVTFVWNSRPDITSKISEFTSVAERLNWQLNELASACANAEATSSLQSIAEQIANGVMPNESDLNLIRRAYESSQKFVSEEVTALPEESELNEYLETFSEDHIFAEEVTDEGNEFSGALAAAKAKGEKTFSVDGKEYQVKEDELEEDRYDVNSATVNKPGHPMHGQRVDLMHKTKDGFMGAGLDPKTRKMVNNKFTKNELTNVNYSGPARGYKDELEEGDGCNMTAEGEYCPVHGMEECMAVQRMSGVNPAQDGNLDELTTEAIGGFGDDDSDLPDDDDFEHGEDDEDYYDDRDYDDDDRSHFADPGGHSALRAATPDNPRIHACPTCGYPNRLTAADVARGYQCDKCADATEQGREIDYYDDPDIDHDLEGEAEPLPMDKDDLYESQVARLKNLAGI